MKRKFKELKDQEIDDLASAVSIAIQNAPKDSPNFKKALTKLNKEIWQEINKRSAQRKS